MLPRPLIIALTLGAGGPVAATGPSTPGNQTREYLLSLVHGSTPRIEGVDPDFECGWRRLAFEFGGTIQPDMSEAQRRALFDSLELETKCGEKPPMPVPRPFEFREEIRRTSAAVARAMRRSVHASIAPRIAAVVFVDPVKGCDSAPGTLADPLKTISAAVSVARAAHRSNGLASTIELRAGTYYLEETIILTEEDEGLTIQAYQEEEAILSGGRALEGLEWKAAGSVHDRTIYEADVKRFNLHGIPALQIGGQRATLARFPNANPERDLFPTGYIAEETTWTAPVDAEGNTCDPRMLCGVSSNLTVPVTDAWHGMYQNYEVGLGGACGRYDPPHSPWCSGKFYRTRQFPEMHTRSPSGVAVGDRMAEYDNATGAVVHAWRPGHWYTWMFEVASTKPGKRVDGWTVHPSANAVNGDVPSPGSSTDTVVYLGNFDVSAGCAEACETKERCTSWTWHEPEFGPPWANGCYGRTDGVWLPTGQGNVVSSRGPHTEGASFVFGCGGHQGGEGSEEAAEWFVENVAEELDAPNEYFCDIARGKLRYIPNSTEPPAPSDEVVVPTLATLIELRGSQSRTVRNVSFRGLTWRANRPTFMEPRGNPSGGDWSLERTGALLLEGTEGVLVEGNLFAHLDSNAISINGYNRGTVIRSNEFTRLGQSAIASWGRPDGNNGLNGDYPRGTLVERNFCHEIGHIQKQSSFYFQAETAETTLRANIVFNIPRAAINFNDGFGGGSEMTENLLFNTCRESSDHGAFNSWDRLPYVTDVRDGTPSSVPAPNDIHRNFIVANYAANGGCLDNDDGSSYYDIHHNVCIYGGHKSDFDGNSKRSFDNLHLYPSVYGVTCISIGAQGLPPAGYAEAYFNNTCVLPAEGSDYIRVPGDLKDPKSFDAGLILSCNKVFAPSGMAKVSVGGTVVTFEEFQAAGFDKCSTLSGAMPSIATMIRWMRDLLSM